MSLIGAAFMSSCSKNTEMNKREEMPGVASRNSTGKASKKSQAAKKPSKGKKESLAEATNAGSSSIDGNDSLTAHRDGQYVNLGWHAGNFGKKIQQIHIIRSPTGAKNNKRKVADLNPDVITYRDCLPNENAQWYWVRLTATDGTEQDIGPVKVDADKNGSASYINPEEKYQVSITRTDEIATLKWDFPDKEYNAIRIVRSASLMDEAFKGRADPVVITPAGKMEYNNALPDPNAEYWYWFQISTKSGAILYKGPIKAEYVRTKRSAAPHGS